MKFLDKTGLQKVINWVKSKFVTALGTSGNYLTWTRNNTTNNITIPYSTNSGTASKLGSSTVGASNRPIYLNAGTPAVTSPGEAFLSWGGQNFSGSYGPIDAAMVDELGACRTMFAKAAGIIVEYSTDSGATWQDYGLTDTQKLQIFSNGGYFYTGKNSTSGGGSANNMLRVTLRTSAAGIYTVLNKFVIYVSTSGSQGCYCTIRCRTQQNYENNVDTWVTFANQVPITGWSGYNVINVSGITTYGNTKNSQYGELQFIFGCTSYSGSYTGLMIYKILGFGGVGWTTPSNMAKTGHLYSFDADQNAYFPAKVTATSIAKSGGTSSQFLKADGSVDSTIYLPTTKLPVNSNFNANNYTGQSMLYTSAGDVGNRAAGWTNFPTSSAPAGGFSLLNIQEGSYARQIFSSYYEDHVYIRSQHYSSGVAWGDWQKIPLYSDIVTTEFYKEVSGYNIP